MKKFALFLFLCLALSSCLPIPLTWPLYLMEGRWYVKNQSGVNIELSCEPASVVQIASGDSALFLVRTGLNSYTPPPFSDFMNVDTVSLSIRYDDNDISDCIYWTNTGEDDLGNRIFDEASWKCYKNDIGEPTWVFTITDQDVFSMR